MNFLAPRTCLRTTSTCPYRPVLAIELHFYVMPLSLVHSYMYTSNLRPGPYIVKWLELSLSINDVMLGSKAASIQSLLRMRVDRLYMF